MKTSKEAAGRIEKEHKGWKEEYERERKGDYALRRIVCFFRLTSTVGLHDATLTLNPIKRSNSTLCTDRLLANAIYWFTEGYRYVIEFSSANHIRRLTLKLVHRTCCI
eukprot:163199-Amorphochlora_amoeboformis.AAC.1